MTVLVIRYSFKRFVLVSASFLTGSVLLFFEGKERACGQFGVSSFVFNGWNVFSDGWDRFSDIGRFGNNAYKHRALCVFRHYRL